MSVADLWLHITSLVIGWLMENIMRHFHEYKPLDGCKDSSVNNVVTLHMFLLDSLIVPAIAKRQRDIGHLNPRLRYKGGGQVTTRLMDRPQLHENADECSLWLLGNRSFIVFMLMKQNEGNPVKVDM